MEGRWDAGGGEEVWTRLQLEEREVQAMLKLKILTREHYSQNNK